MFQAKIEIVGLCLVRESLNGMDPAQVFAIKSSHADRGPTNLVLKTHKLSVNEDLTPDTVMEQLVTSLSDRMLRLSPGTTIKLATSSEARPSWTAQEEVTPASLTRLGLGGLARRFPEDRIEGEVELPMANGDSANMAKAGWDFLLGKYFFPHTNETVNVADMFLWFGNYPEGKSLEFEISGLEGSLFLQARRDQGLEVAIGCVRAEEDGNPFDQFGDYGSGARRPQELPRASIYHIGSSSCPPIRDV